MARVGYRELGQSSPLGRSTTGRAYRTFVTGGRSTEVGPPRPSAGSSRDYLLFKKHFRTQEEAEGFLRLLSSVEHAVAPHQVDLLREVATRDPSESLRSTALQTLAFHSSAEDVPLLLDLVEHKPRGGIAPEYRGESEVLIAACSLALWVGSDRLLPIRSRLVDALERLPSMRSRSRALAWMVGGLLRWADAPHNAIRHLRDFGFDQELTIQGDARSYLQDRKWLLQQTLSLVGGYGGREIIEIIKYLDRNDVPVLAGRGLLELYTGRSIELPEGSPFELVSMAFKARALRSAPHPLRSRSFEQFLVDRCRILAALHVGSLQFLDETGRLRVRVPRYQPPLSGRMEAAYRIGGTEGLYRHFLSEVQRDTALEPGRPSDLELIRTEWKAWQRVASFERARLQPGALDP